MALSTREGLDNPGSWLDQIMRLIALLRRQFPSKRYSRPTLDTIGIQLLVLCREGCLKNTFLFQSLCPKLSNGIVPRLRL